MTTQLQPNWLTEADDILQASFVTTAKRRSKVTKAKANGKASVKCEGYATNIPTQTVYLRMPSDVFDRLKGLTKGKLTSTVAWMMIENTLNEIESRNEEWTFSVEN